MSSPFSILIFQAISLWAKMLYFLMKKSGDVLLRPLCRAMLHYREGAQDATADSYNCMCFSATACSLYVLSAIW